MRELANSFAQLLVIIMVTLVLAVSTAAVSQWASVDATSTGAAGAAQPSTLLVSESR